MSVRVIGYNESLDRVWEELTYTEARMLADPHARDLAPAVTSLLEREETARRGQRLAWRGEIGAQAGVDAADDSLDDTVEDIGQEALRAEGGNRRSPRFVRYFPQAPHEIMRLGLATELPRVRSWVESLKGEPETKLKELGAGLAGNIATGEKALQGREKAAAARADQRVRELVPFIDDVNAARLSLYGTLIGRVQQHGLPRDWPERFFRRSVRGARTSTSQPQ